MKLGRRVARRRRPRLAWLVKAVKEIDAGVPAPGSPGCCYERVSQCLDLCGLCGQHALDGVAVGRSPVEIMYERVAGIDVHKKQVTVAVRTPGARRGRCQQVRR